MNVWGRVCKRSSCVSVREVVFICYCRRLSWPMGICMVCGVVWCFAFCICLRSLFFSLLCASCPRFSGRHFVSVVCTIIQRH